MSHVERREIGSKNYKNLIVRYESFLEQKHFSPYWGCMGKQRRALDLAFAGLYYFRDPYESDYYRCAYCSYRYTIKPGYITAAVLNKEHFQFNGDDCKRINHIARMILNRDCKKEAWAEAMGILPFLLQHYTHEEISDWSENDDFLDKILLIKEKVTGNLKCVICKRRKIAALTIPCGHLLTCRICCDLQVNCTECNSIITTTWFPKLHGVVEPVFNKKTIKVENIDLK